MYRRKLLLAAWLFTPLLALYQREIPPHEGPDHQGQPKWCQNYADPNTGYRKNCDCHKKCERGAAEDPKCSVYCRKNACKCAHGCES